MFTATRNFSLVQTLLFVAVSLLVLVGPVVTHAQESADLQSAVRTALLSDPRSASMQPAQFEALVSVLTQQAQKQGMTVQDVTWRPSSLSTFTTAQPLVFPVCNPGSILCRVNSALGFAGADITIPIALAITSALLLLIVGAMLAAHRRRLSMSMPVQSQSTVRV